MKKITFNSEEKYMYLTSNLFTLPSIFGLYNDFLILSNLNFLSSIVSSIFWSKGYDNLSRKIDLIFQPIVGAAFFFYGNTHFKRPLLTLIGNLFFLNGLYFYRKSALEYKKYNRLWYINHLVFHSSMICAQFITYVV